MALPGRADSANGLRGKAFFTGQANGQVQGFAWCDGLEFRRSRVAVNQGVAVGGQRVVDA